MHTKTKEKKSAEKFPVWGRYCLSKKSGLLLNGEYA